MPEQNCIKASWEGTLPATDERYGKASWEGALPATDERYSKASWEGAMPATNQDCIPKGDSI